MKKIIQLVIIIAVIAVIGSFGFSVYKKIQKFDQIMLLNRNSKILIKQKFINIYSVSKQKEIEIDLDNKNIFIHFWASWCKPCVEEFNDLDALIYKTNQVKFYFISEEAVEKVNEFQKFMGLRNIKFYTIDKANNPFKINNYPTTFHNINDSLYNRIVGKSDWNKFFNNIVYD
ncbi:MAG: TlpA family protein disulfide reductase [Bacteroidetes bacterium]|nr:TlpA family protein disulfide reductase [Bacteroidota bacterium]